MAVEPALNDRQRAYLLAIFETDQAVETDVRSIPYRPFQPRPKDSEWRWLEYSEPVLEIDYPSPLATTLAPTSARRLKSGSSN